MPEPLGPLNDPDDDPGVARRRALWAMAVLACLALIVGGLMLLLGGGSAPSSKGVDLLPPVQTPAATTPPARPSMSATSSVSSSPAAGPSFGSSPAGPPRSGNPCSGASTCLVDGDGGALAALNAYRAAHGSPPVPGAVTHNAQVCARNRGSGSTCVPHYAWTAMSDQDGAQAVEKIAAFGRNWLLDRSITSIGVGWAYVGGQYECVLLKSP